MDQQPEIETVFCVETPYADAEEEISTSYGTVKDNKESTPEKTQLLETEDGMSISYVDINSNEELNNQKTTNVHTEEEISVSYVDIKSEEDSNEAQPNNQTGNINDIDEAIDQVVCQTEPMEKVIMLTSMDDDSSNTNELKENEFLPEDLRSNPQCHVCKKTFSRISNKMKHLRRVHKLKQGSYTSIKCIECNMFFNQLAGLRGHLNSTHKLEMSEYNLQFPNMEAFKKWKCEIERKNVCSYTLRHGARKGTTGPRFFYACHRSGKYLPKVQTCHRQRMIKTQGSCKMGILCTSAIAVHVTSQCLQVKYYPNHYGHGKETTLIQLSIEEQSAIQESVSKGVPYEKLLDDIRDGQSNKDHFQLHLLKKKDYRSINNAYGCDDFNTSLSDAESVDHWVGLCCQMENSPILFYRKEEVYHEKKTEEEFILIIMTEFQKHILQSSDKNVICVDSLYRRKGGRFYLTCLFIMDENDLAFPVAFCISNKVDKTIISLFYQALRESAGPLECNFFMSDCELFYYEAWKEVMDDKSRWLWSMWYVDSRFRIQLRVFKGKFEKRAEAYRTMRMLLECQNPTVFQCMLQKFAEHLKNDPDSKDLGNVVESHYAPNAEIWAYCYRKEIDLATNIHLEIMHRTFRYCCREGRKTRLDKFIFVIMKLVRDKMLDRLSSMLDDDRIEMAIETINQCHNLGLEISADSITALSDKTWLIQIEGEEENHYVMREHDTCPEHCNLKCSECDICVHLYICSCIHNLINANLCQHIHAVVWHLLTPHFSPPTSPVPLLDTKIVNKPEEESEFITNLLKKSHEVYKQIQANKTKLNKSALNSLMKRLNECVDICVGKLVDVKKSPESPAPSVPVTNPSTLYVFNPMPATAGEGNNQGMILSETAGSAILQHQPVANTSHTSILLPPVRTVNSTIQPQALGNNSQRFVLSNAANSSILQSQGGYYIIMPSNCTSVPPKVNSS